MSPVSSSPPSWSLLSSQYSEVPPPKPSMLAEVLRCEVNYPREALSFHPPCGQEGMTPPLRRALATRGSLSCVPPPASSSWAHPACPDGSVLPADAAAPSTRQSTQLGPSPGVFSEGAEVLLQLNPLHPELQALRTRERIRHIHPGQQILKSNVFLGCP